MGSDLLRRGRCRFRGSSCAADLSRGPYAGEASHYETLGLTPAATHEEVRQAYIERALRFHPDRQEGQDVAGRAEAERRMQAVNGAWAVLGDREGRAAYDAELGITREGDDPFDDESAAPAPAGLRATLRRFVGLFVVLALLALFLVFTAYAGAGRS